MTNINMIRAEQVRAGLEQHDVKITGLTRAATRITDLQTWGHTGPADLPGIVNHQNQASMLAHAVHDSLIAGNDPTTDPTVTRIITAQTITASVFYERVTNIAVADYAKAISDNEDKIIAKLTPAFDRHVAALTLAAERLGESVDLDDDSAVLELDLRADALPARDARKALTRMTGLLQIIDQLTTGQAQPAALHLAALSADDWDTLGLTSSRPADMPDVYEMAKHGVTWSLAGTVGTQQRVDTLAAERRDHTTTLNQPETASQPA